jgi:hypothetical protein
MEKQTQERESSTIGSTLRLLLTDWKAQTKAATLLALLIITIGAIEAITIWLIKPDRITISQNGYGTIIYSLRGPKFYTYLLSASTVWAPTGIWISDQHDVLIRASGSVNLAFHRLVEAAVRDTLPPQPWIEPDGLIDESRLSEKAIKRKPALIYRRPNAHYGTLIAGVSSDKDTPPTDPHDMWEVGKEWRDVPRKSGYLFFVVNDALLDSSMQAIYELPDKNGTRTSERSFSEILTMGYFKLWFDDNAGSFLITVDMEPE